MTAPAWPAAQHIYLSPHLDDVVLSCGGLIFQQVQRGESVAVITVFAASPPSGSALSPFAGSLHERWQASASSGFNFSDPPAVRRAEDIHAFAAISPAIQVIHNALPECIYRTNPVTGEALYASEEAIFGAVHPADPAIGALYTTPPLPPDVTLYAPLAVGHHVDHQIVRQAVSEWNLPPERVRYYEDYPYAGREEAVVAALGDRSQWQPILVELDEEALAAKIRAIAAYESQISTFWLNATTMAGDIRRHVARAGGERLWIRAAGRVVWPG